MGVPCAYPFHTDPVAGFIEWPLISRSFQLKITSPLNKTPSGGHRAPPCKPQNHAPDSETTVVQRGRSTKKIIGLGYRFRVWVF